MNPTVVYENRGLRIVMLPPGPGESFEALKCEVRSYDAMGADQWVEAANPHAIIVEALRHYVKQSRKDRS